jgi:hypothetical protein
MWRKTVPEFCYADHDYQEVPITLKRLLNGTNVRKRIQLLTKLRRIIKVKVVKEKRTKKLSQPTIVHVYDDNGKLADIDHIDGRPVVNVPLGYGFPE